MKAGIWRAIGELECGDVPEPAAGAGEVLVHRS